MVGLSRLTQLELFYLSHNELESLPEDLKDIQSLKVFDVRHNPHLGEHAGFYEGKQLEELKGWLEEFQSGSERQNVIKVMLVGEGISQNSHLFFFLFLPTISNIRTSRKDLHRTVSARSRNQRGGTNNHANRWH